jgi:hypothetical protein
VDCNSVFSDKGSLKVPKLLAFSALKFSSLKSLAKPI